MSEPVPPRARARREDARRKPYHSPKLERLGTLTDITAASSVGQKSDHGQKPLNKTG